MESTCVGVGGWCVGSVVASREDFKSVCVGAQCVNAGFVTWKTEVRGDYITIHFIFNFYMCN